MKKVWVLILVFLLGVEASADEKQPLSYQSSLEGKTIRSIDVNIRDIFEDPHNFIYRSANSLKISTRQRIVRQELLFKKGDSYNRFSIEESERNLRRLKFLREAEITGVADGEYVDIQVSVRDTWTLIPQFAYSSGTGDTRFLAGLAESNLLGYGNRLELLYEEEEDRESVAAVFDSQRLSGEYDLLSGIFDRDDGERFVFNLDKPYRSFLEKEAWSFGANVGDTIGRLFYAGDERYIFRQKENDLGAWYSFSKGNSERKIRRYYLGYRYQDKTFSQATAQDYDNLDLDPALVSNDPASLAEDRRYTGPTFKIKQTVPNFISMNYIDRFERVLDYNLGPEDTLSFFFAPRVVGSSDDALIVTGNRSQGKAFSKGSFIRGEFGFATRFAEDAFENSLARLELKYYNVLGPLYLRDFFLGKHTFAAAFFIDYGYDLDADRELLIGGDNALRGYEAKTFTGDKRIALNIEQRLHIAENVWDLISFGAAFFAEAGGATERSFGNLIADEIYADFGAGLRFAFPRSSGQRVLRLDVAFPLRDGPDGSGDMEPRFILSGGQIFGARLRSESVGAERASVGIGFDN